MSQGYVYFFQASDGRVKIGKSDDPRRRLRDLSSRGRKLTVLGVMASDEPFAEEAGVHAALVKHHIEGEWFNGNVVAAIDAYRPRFLAELPESQHLIQVWVSPEFHAECVARAKSEGRSLANWLRHELGKLTEIEEP
jgi:hypothetical protein